LQVKLHRNATTTPAVRGLIQHSSAPTAELAQRFGVNQTTIRRWRNRAGEVLDRSHARHRRGQSTDPTSAALIGELRTTLGLSLDDIVEVMRRCLDPNLSRSAILRCLQRLGLSRRPATKTTASGRFAPEPCGFIHLDLKHLTRLRGERAYAYVAIDRATRFVHLEIHAAQRLQRRHHRGPATIPAASPRFAPSADRAAPRRPRPPECNPRERGGERPAQNANRPATCGAAWSRRGRRNGALAQQKPAERLACPAQAVHRVEPRPYQIAHRPVAAVGNPHRRQLAGAMQPRQARRIPPIGLDPVVDALGDQRGGRPRHIRARGPSSDGE
jgi:transposase